MTWENYLRIIYNVGYRYAFFAGLGFLIFYVLFRKHWQYKKIQPRFPKNTDYLREIGYSAVSISIFALAPLLLVFNLEIRPYTQLMDTPDELGWVYFGLAFVIMFFMHDAYFYWTHRLMHHPRLFKYFHLVHHKSTNPSPWAAYAFHPLEAVVEQGIYVIFVFLIPLYKVHIFIFFLFQIIYNVYGHLGYELYPRGFNKTWIGRWVNTSVSHNLHHRFFKGNYGLYTMIWDRWMGTAHPQYDEYYDQATQHSYLRKKNEEIKA
jgi:Delta7-sterol 5-desaturase